MLCVTALTVVTLKVLRTTSAQVAPRDLYSKYEYMIPMRDGVKLYTQVYVPKTVSGKHPILMERTCYGAGPKGPTAFKNHRGSPKLQTAGYIFAYQDVRGKGFSEGDFVNIRPQLKPGQKGIDESTDTWDTVDYLVKHVPDNNNKVGMWGISYPGFYTAVGAINSHPSLAAISPQAPVSDWFLGDDVHHNGAFFTQDNFDFSAGFDVPRGGARPTINRGSATAYEFFLKAGSAAQLGKTYYQGLIPYWDELMQHGTLDEYWKARSLPDKLKGVKCAVLTVGGLFDAEDMWGALNDFQYFEKQNRGIPNFLVMGPWFHGGWAGGTGRKFGDIDFGTDVSAYFRNEIEFPFFEKYLRDQAVAAPAKATIFETGGNRFRKFAQWPPKYTSKFEAFLSPNMTLSGTAPSTDGKVSYDNDPTAPTPYVTDWETSKRRPSTYMLDDQTWASKRKDVVTFTGPTITSDLTVAGPVDVDFWVTTSGTDGDFVVKLIDVYPASELSKTRTDTSMANYQMLVRGDVMRGKFRNSFEKPEPFVPGQPTRVHFKMNDVLHTFRYGHKVMIQVQSNWFPLVDRNPNKFIDIYSAKDSDYEKATISLLFGPSHASKVSIGVLGN